MSGELGCASTYRVELVQVQVQDYDTGQALPAPVQWGGEDLLGVSRVEWGRTVNDVSEAVITVSGAADSSQCCDQVNKIKPKLHEVRLWRDGQNVWEGPISEDVETTQGGDYVITARDVLSWFEPDEGRPNLYDLNYTSDDPVAVAESIIRRNLTDTWAVPPDYPMVLDYLYTEPVGEAINYQPGLVIEYLIDLLDELTDYGLMFGTLGRSIFLTGGADNATAVTAQLTQEHIDAPVDITQDGGELGNVGIGVRPDADDTDLPPDVFMYGNPSSPYRPAYRVVDVHKWSNDATANRAAREAIRGRGVPPLVVTMSGNAKLWPHAPIQINEIIPGWTRVDYMTAGRGTEGICKRVLQPMTFSELSVDWVPGMETVQVAMVPVGPPTGVGPGGGG